MIHQGLARMNRALARSSQGRTVHSARANKSIEKESSRLRLPLGFRLRLSLTCLGAWPWFLLGCVSSDPQPNLARQSIYNASVETAPSPNPGEPSPGVELFLRPRGAGAEREIEVLGHAPPPPDKLRQYQAAARASIEGLLPEINRKCGSIVQLYEKNREVKPMFVSLELDFKGQVAGSRVMGAGPEDYEFVGCVLEQFRATEPIGNLIKGNVKKLVFPLQVKSRSTVPLKMSEKKD